MPVNHERVVADLELMFGGDLGLSLLDPRIDEFFHVSAIETEDVIVMRPGIELEHRHAVGEMVSRNQTRRLELGEHTIDGGKTNVLAQIDQPPVYILGRHVTLAGAFEDLEDLHARQRDLESRFTQVFSFHVITPPLR
jgi:hypothetical protein